MAKNINNVKLGACDITFKSVNLGHTIGGVELSYEQMFTDISVDEYGKTVVDKRLDGEKLTAKFKLAEYTIDNLNAAIPNGIEAGSGNARLTIGAKAGASLLSQAGLLVIHPTANGSSRLEDIVMYKAASVSTVPLHHKNDEIKTIEITMQALLDETKANGSYMGLIGDSAA